MMAMPFTLRDKTVLITGATSGLGKATAIACAKRGATVVMVARNRERGEAARQEIVALSAQTGQTGSERQSQVDLLLADVSSQADIRRVAGEFQAKYDALHVLINNVGNTFMTRQVSADGIEMSLAVNHLAPFLLTNLLLVTLKRSAPARIVNVGTRLNTAMNFNDLQFHRRPYRGLMAYGQSKLGNLHFTFELALRLAGTGVAVNCVHPGVFRSNLGRNAGPTPRWIDLLTTMSSPFLAPAEKAAERVMYVATAPELEGVTGKYFGDRQELPAPAQTQDPAARQRLWEISAALTRLA
jgi:NAD(P)-dependent dehydrogenase (short-subunit alcohol dehydrogenase family)